MRKSNALELAILALLQASPLHGYELRKRLTTQLGTLRAISFGALYPALKALTDAGHIEETEDRTAAGPALSAKRSRITYSITADGELHLQDLLSDSGPDTWDDEGFGVRLALFGATKSDVRRRILEGRRSRLAERRATLRESLNATRERLDQYTLALQRHGLDGVENELRWIDDLIEQEDRTARS